MAKKEKKATPVVPPSEIPEVAAYEEVKQRLQTFKEANKEFFEFLEQLVEDHNTKLEAAIKATKDREVSSGDFDLYQWHTKIDPLVLFQSLGHEKFLAAGGKVNTVTEYGVDKARIESAINAGVIPKAIAEAAVTKSPRFHKPDKLNTP